ncbi:hypothetical protein ACWCXC_05760 [Streptomyces sp. NPDC001515]
MSGTRAGRRAPSGPIESQLPLDRGPHEALAAAALADTVLTCGSRFRPP